MTYAEALTEINNHHQQSIELAREDPRKALEVNLILLDCLIELMDQSLRKV